MFPMSCFRLEEALLSEEFSVWTTKFKWLWVFWWWFVLVFFLSGSADVFSLSGPGEVAVSAARKN